MGAFNNLLCYFHVSFVKKIYAAFEKLECFAAVLLVHGGKINKERAHSWDNMQFTAGLFHAWQANDTYAKM